MYDQTGRESRLETLVMRGMIAINRGVKGLLRSLLELSRQSTAFKEKVGVPFLQVSLFPLTTC